MADDSGYPDAMPPASLKAKIHTAVEPMRAPVERAMVFICQKCGKRAGGALKHASYELASNIKRATKHEFGKGKVRVCLTSCMDACPEEHIAVSLQQVGSDGSSMFFEADVHDVEGASDALLQLMRP